MTDHYPPRLPVDEAGLIAAGQPLPPKPKAQLRDRLSDLVLGSMFGWLWLQRHRRRREARRSVG